MELNEFSLDMAVMVGGMIVMVSSGVCRSSSRRRRLCDYQVWLTYAAGMSVLIGSVASLLRFVH